MNIHFLTRRGFIQTVAWALLFSTAVVGAAAALGRGILNVKAALTDQPDLAVYLLLPEKGVTQTTLLRSSETRRDYLIQTKDGPEILQLKKGTKWYIENEQALHESGN